LNEFTASVDGCVTLQNIEKQLGGHVNWKTKVKLGAYVSVGFRKKKVGNSGERELLSARHEITEKGCKVTDPTR